MTLDQTLLIGLLAAAIGLFAWGRWRHDLVALAVLLAAVLAGLTPAQEAFEGFGHPAVVTVACMLALSRALQDSGVVDEAARRLLPDGASATATIAGLTALAAALSGFMNNVGALALLMPIALKAADRLSVAPGRLLMPLSFGSILGGMTTLVGTPPNLIVSGYRRDLTGEAFGMFDFTPAGLAVAVAGVAFVSLIGWRLVPERRRAGTEGFESGAYFAEARVPEDAKAVGMRLNEIENAAEAADVQVLGIVRSEVRLRAPSPALRARAGDILVLEAEPEGLAGALSALGIELVAAERERDSADRDAPGDDTGKPAPEETAEEDEADAAPSPVEVEETRLVELVVAPSSPAIGRSAAGLDLRARYRIDLLAISRRDRRSVGRLRSTLIEPGDVLLVQGGPDAVSAFAADFACLPLAERPLRLPERGGMRLAAGIFAGSIALAATGLVAAHIAFALGVLAALLTRVLTPRGVFRAVDWSVVVLLACLLPVADAMLSTGAAEVIANTLIGGLAGDSALLALVIVLVATMTLSDAMNNAATVAVMAPIAYGAAQSLGASTDAFFMAVAIGGSCAFLTPIGHQNNTLILGPGGFRFGDYWRLGLLVEVIVVAVGVPMVVAVWGL